MLIPPSAAFAYFASGDNANPSAGGGLGVAVTGGNSANGAAVAWGGGALSFEGQLIEVKWALGGTSSTDTRSLIDVLIDPAGGTSWAATPLITGLLAGFGNGNVDRGRRIMLPLRIPSGANLGYRARSLTTGRTHRVLTRVWGGYRPPGHWRCGAKSVSLGVDEANYNGTVHTPGNSNAWAASWTNIGSPLESDAWCFNLACGGENDGTWNATNGYGQIGVSSTQLHNQSADDPHLRWEMSSTELMNVHYGDPVWATLPAGSQLQVRAKGSAASAQPLGFAIYAVVG